MEAPARSGQLDSGEAVNRVGVELRRAVARLKRLTAVPVVVYLGSFAAAVIFRLPQPYWTLLIVLGGPAFATLYWALAARVVRSHGFERCRAKRSVPAPLANGSA